MSQAQFIEYRGQGFWAFDVISKVLLKNLIDVTVVRARKSESQWLAEAVSAWRQAAVISDYGVRIDETWTAEQITVFADLMEDTCSLLAERDVIPAEEITAWQIPGNLRISTRAMTTVPTKAVVQLGRAIVALVGGSLPAALTGTWWFYGIDDAPSTIRKRIQTTD